MKSIDKIPVGKVSRASKLISTGLKVGTNQLKYYGDRLINPEDARERLNEKNAEDIYNSLSQLKGSSLKVAQMLSMDKNVLPEAYVEKFSLAQFSVPALSAPLVNKTFLKYFGQRPQELFDEFVSEASHAASIGQVHKAVKDGKELAVKIQYPGVAESISSDLAIVKPIAKQMFNLKGGDTERYFREVESKLLEETDYVLELNRSLEITQACSVIPHLRFPNYYKDWSNERIITMDWMHGTHLSAFEKSNQAQALADQLGQTLWDFYMYQIHVLRKVHADPHPGNFLVNDQGELVAIDFGCIKEIPESFYTPYFELADYENIHNDELFEAKLFELEILKKEDSAEEHAFFKSFFQELLALFTTPLQSDSFDFNNADFFNKIAEKGQQISKDKAFRKFNQNRGSEHFIYMNRTFFGLYNLLFALKSNVRVKDFVKYSPDPNLPIIKKAS
ncbi:ABC1 kinase family protein [Reichenbachiella ulvae]|uniref:AarF/UbiB family protein n=1 Tax=Reichenbachiella ulvae TaxID=2980104 RepID=A0ABT3CW49_9BACT|nr:AarF/UbiB family protein [Reichenbachiella ulvae]MCV9387744.1 AarF/UbiB family protein [Reichenbachiella ulvae]